MTKMHVVADMEINKFLRSFQTREGAIDYVGRLLKTNGNEYVHDLSISRQTNEGTFVDIVSGDELLALVQKAAARREPVSAGGGSHGGNPYGGEVIGSRDSGYGYGALAAKGYE